MRLLRRLGRAHGRLRDALLRLVAPPVDVEPATGSRSRLPASARLRSCCRSSCRSCRSRTIPASPVHSTKRASGRHTCAAYLASGSHAHEWMLPLIKDWNSAVLFPGFLGLVLGLAGVGDRMAANDACWRGVVAAIAKQPCSTASVAVLAFWATLGPRAGLYTRLLQRHPGVLVPPRAGAHGHRRHAVRWRSSRRLPCGTLGDRWPARRLAVGAVALSRRAARNQRRCRSTGARHAAAASLSRPGTDAARRRSPSFRSTAGASTSTSTPATC